MYAKSHHVTGVKVNKNNPCLLLGKIDFYHTLKQSPTEKSDAPNMHIVSVFLGDWRIHIRVYYVLHPLPR